MRPYKLSSMNFCLIAAMPRRKRRSPFDTITMENTGVLTQLPRGFPDNEKTEIPPDINRLIQFLSLDTHKKPEEMYCFIMYDIEDNKVRRLVAKYLEKKGCMRVQKSIFFAKLHRKLYLEVTTALKEIQDAYENKDSILAMPVGEDMLNSLLIIGKELTYEFNRKQSNTYFF